MPFPAQESANPNGWQLDTGTPEDIGQLSPQLGLTNEELAQDICAGVLRFMDTPQGRAWVVTDRTGICAQARLLSGDIWNDNASPVMMLPGSRNVPLGLDDIGDFPTVYVVTGGRDWLVMREILRSATPENITAWVSRDARRQAALDAVLKNLTEKTCVAMPDTDTPLTKEQGEAFQFKRVRLFPHGGKTGNAALQSWGRIIKPQAIELDVFPVEALDCKSVCDLWLSPKINNPKVWGGFVA